MTTFTLSSGVRSSAKIFVALGEDVLPPRLLLDEEGFQRLHVRAVELVLQRLQPAWVQPYRVVHDVPPPPGLCESGLPPSTALARRNRCRYRGPMTKAIQDRKSTRLNSSH